MSDATPPRERKYKTYSFHLRRGSQAAILYENQLLREHNAKLAAQTDLLTLVLIAAREQPNPTSQLKGALDLAAQKIDLTPVHTEDYRRMVLWFIKRRQKYGGKAGDLYRYFRVSKRLAYDWKTGRYLAKADPFGHHQPKHTGAPIPCEMQPLPAPGDPPQEVIEPSEVAPEVAPREVQTTAPLFDRFHAIDD